MQAVATTLNDRSAADGQAPLGIATTNVEARIMAATGTGGNAAPEFEAHDGVFNAGVLFLLPALIAQGLLKTNDVYQLPASHYYSLSSIILTLAFMALLRIKNPEQLKQCKPGEIGKIIGLDRIPEVRNLRSKLQLLSDQQQAQKLNNLLVDHWYGDRLEDGMFLYIDGHVRVYHGYKANLPVKFVSREKLCLNATTEFWVNDSCGLPVMHCVGELTEKLKDAIEDLIIPQLLETVLLPASQLPGQRADAICQTGQGQSAPLQPLQAPGNGVADAIEVTKSSTKGNKDQKSPICTFVFDRESYEPEFYQRLWDKYRIAVLTYRKNVKDKWDNKLFITTDVMVLDNKVSMRICEQQITLDNVSFREIRKLADDDHQTSIITTDNTIATEVVAGRMFGRWSQENFFRYMISDYDFDKMIEYGTEEIDDKKEIVNPAYRKLSQQLKKAKEKTQRLQAKMYTLAEESIEDDIEDAPKLLKKQASVQQQIEESLKNQQQIDAQRQRVPARIKLKDMPDNTRYNGLKKESKLLMNTIKMICYRAETAVANIFSENKFDKEEKRMIVKQLMQNNADIYPDYENKTLTIKLHTLSAPRYNLAAQKLAELLNETETKFPGTELRLIFKTHAP